MEATKRCNKCGMVKPLTEFVKDRSHKDGYRSQCKPCHNEEKRTRRAANPERDREIQRRCRLANPEKAREGVRRWQEANREKTRKAALDYYYANSEKVREAQRRRILANPEKKREQDRRYLETHPGKKAESARRYREANPEKRRETDRKHREEHPEIVKQRRQVRRARQKNAPGTHKAADVKRQFLEQQGMCFWCSEELQPRWHLDHVIPFDRGGSNWPENLVCACPRCNLQKNKRVPFLEWEPRNPLKQIHEIAVLVQWLTDRQNKDKHE